MFMGEDTMDMWEPVPAQATFMWTAAEDSGMTWASGHEVISDWNSLDGTTAVFGGHREEEEENVVVESCVRNGDHNEDEVERPPRVEAFEELEEQMQFFEGSPYLVNHDTDATVSPSDSPRHEDTVSLDETNYLECTSFEFVSDTRPSSPVWLTEEEEDEIVRGIPAAAKKAALSVNIIGQLLPVTDSVVSTPDVVNDVIDLENDGLLRSTTSNPQEAQQEETTIIYEEEDLDDEFTVEFIDESVITSPQSRTTSAPTSSATTENEQEEEEDSDVEYKPPVPKKKRNRSLSSSEGKKRGRPAKPLKKAINPRELRNLAPEEKLYKVRRFKNNEASRLSRFNRRQKDLKLGEQCDMFADENEDLRRVLKAHNRLHNKLRALIVGIKISI